MLAIVAQQPAGRVFSAAVTSLVVWDVSEATMVPAGLLAATIAHESGFKVTARRGPCCGLGQVDHRYSAFTCAEMRSNVDVSVLASAIALKTWRKKADSWHGALACYATGNSCAGTVYADKVMEIWKTYRR